MSRILSIVPYKFMPPTSGGAWGIIWVDKLLSEFNEVTTVSVAENGTQGDWPFKLENVLPDSRTRYVPYKITGILKKLAARYRPEYLFCHHHYLFPAVRSIAKRLHIPAYIRSHNIEAERFRTVGKWWWKLMWSFEQWAYRKADRVFFVTEVDAAWSIAHYGLSPEKVSVMPFVCDFDSVQKTDKDKGSAAAEHKLKADVPWFLFLGVLNYGPNEDAVRIIINEIYPRLKSKLPDFEIIICGKNLNPVLQEQISKLEQVKYLGFVPDLNPLLQHAAVMLNAVVSGGGVKTKVIESLSWDLTVVSAATGATGIDQKHCGDKLVVVEDGDWEGMAQAVIKALENETHIPDAFFEYYYLKNVARRLQQYFQ